MNFFKGLFGKKTGNKTNLEPEVTTKLNETTNKKEGVYYEKDNIGTRILTADRNQAAYNSWVLNGSPEIGVINYHFKTKKEAYSAMMEIPCIKLAADSKNLISLEIIEFGVFLDSDNDNDWEAFLQGQSLSLSSFKSAEASFIKHNGKKIFSKEPKNPEQTKAKPENMPRVTNSSGVKFIRNTNVEMMGVTGTKEIYEAPDKKSAIEFLKTKTILKQYYFIEIETPDGWVGKDIDGVYET